MPKNTIHLAYLFFIVCLTVSGGTVIFMQQSKIIALESESSASLAENMSKSIDNENTDVNEIEDIKVAANDADVLETTSTATSVMNSTTALDAKPSPQPANQGDLNDSTIPTGRMQQGRSLVKQGQYQQALEHFLWCFDEGEKYRGFSGVRLSFLLSDIMDLSKHYPPAKQALLQRRDEIETKWLLGPGDTSLINEFTALNRVLQEEDRSINLLNQLAKTDSRRQTLVNNMFEQLVNAQRYQDIFLDLTPEAYFDTKESSYKLFKDRPRRENDARQARMDDVQLQFLIRNGRLAVEVLAGVEESGRAMTLIDRLFAYDKSITTLEDLKRAVSRTGNKEVLNYLDNYIL